MEELLEGLVAAAAWWMTEVGLPPLRWCPPEWLPPPRILGEFGLPPCPTQPIRATASTKGRAEKECVGLVKSSHNITEIIGKQVSVCWVLPGYRVRIQAAMTASARALRSGNWSGLESGLEVIIRNVPAAAAVYVRWHATINRTSRKWPYWTRVGRLAVDHIGSFECGVVVGGSVEKRPWWGSLRRPISFQSQPRGSHQPNSTWRRVKVSLHERLFVRFRIDTQVHGLLRVGGVVRVFLGVTIGQPAWELDITVEKKSLRNAIDSAGRGRGPLVEAVAERLTLDPTIKTSQNIN